MAFIPSKIFCKRNNRDRGRIMRYKKDMFPSSSGKFLDFTLQRPERDFYKSRPLISI